jgi:hypothetical protein
MEPLPKTIMSLPGCLPPHGLDLVFGSQFRRLDPPDPLGIKPIVRILALKDLK